jgi:DNA mismatch repair ATPase MutS
MTDVRGAQIGAFFEFWNDDAQEVGKALGLPVGQRDRGDPTPVCAIPEYRIAGDCETLEAKGFNVSLIVDGSVMPWRQAYD